METNYIAKRLKLILPVFALLMLTPFLVNAQDKADLALLNNVITAPDPATFCGPEEVTITGTTAAQIVLEYEGDDCPIIDGPFFAWIMDTQDVFGDWEGDWMLIPGETGHNLTMTVTENTRFRREVYAACAEGAAVQLSNTVEIFIVEEELNCEDNVISLTAGAFDPPNLSTTFCADYLPQTIDIYGHNVYLGAEECGEAEYVWEVRYDGGAWETLIGETDNDLLGFVIDHTAELYEFQRHAIGAGYEYGYCVSDIVEVGVFDNIEDLEIKGPAAVCIPIGFDNHTATYTADFELFGEYDYDDFDYIWNVEAAYGTFDGQGDAPNKVRVAWHTETPLGAPAVLELTVETPDGCSFGPIEYLVDVSRRPEATIISDYMREFCLEHGQFDGEGDFFFVGAIELEAEYSIHEPSKMNGQWSKIAGPENVTYVVPAAGYAAPDPFDTDSWVAVSDTEGYEHIWAVAIWEEEELEDATDCLQLFYAFEWVEFGAGVCAHSTDYVKAIFYKPYLEFTADVAAGYSSPVCGNMIGLSGTPLIDYCFDDDELYHEIVGEWTVTAMPEGVLAGDVVFSDPGYGDTYVTVPEYGTYEFTWTVDNGECGVEYDAVEVMFDAQPVVDAGADQDVCNNYTSSENAAYTYLDASVYLYELGHEPYEYEHTALWTVESKPAGAGDPTFIDEADPKTRVLVSSLGEYVFKYEVWSENEACYDYDYVTVRFYPGLGDVDLATIPEEKDCSLAFQVDFAADYDFGNLSGPENLDYHFAGEFSVYQRQVSGAWAPYEHYSIENYAAFLDPADIVGNTLPFVAPSKAAIDDQLTIRVEHYGQFRVTYNVWVADGRKIEHPVFGACEAQLTTSIDLFWKPVALIIDSDEAPDAVCGVSADDYIVLTGSEPKHANTPVTVTGTGTGANPWVWNQDFGFGFPNNWNQSVIDWYAKEWDEDAGEWIDTDNVVFTRIETDDYFGRKVQVHATVQGYYRVFYEIYNRRGDCLDTDWHDVGFMEFPVAGVDMDYEYCGYFYPEVGDEACEGWGRTTRYGGKEAQLMAVTGSNFDDPDVGQFINGYWTIDLGDIIAGQDLQAAGFDIGYLARGERYPWTPVVGAPGTYELNDWIKVDGEYLYLVHPTTGLYMNPAVDLTNPEAMIEVSRHGYFPFVWVAENPLAVELGMEECAFDYAEHNIYFKNTPLTRDLRPIQVTTMGGKTYLANYVDGEWTDGHPYDDCYACDDEVLTYYMLERPMVEQYNKVDDMVPFYEHHWLVGDFWSTIPAQNSLRWYTKTGAFVPPMGIPGSIDGGLILQTYGLKWDDVEEMYYLVDYTEFPNYNKHHIALIQWDNEPRVGQLRVEEENTVTECLDVHKFNIQKVSEQVIASEGPVEVPSYSDGHVYYFVDDEASDTDHPIPGAVYEWDLVADEGSFITAVYDGIAGVWVDLEEGTLEVAGEGYYKIEVYWMNGLPATADVAYPHGWVYGQIENSCHPPIDPILVYVIDNVIAGQLKYWNQDESRIPSPFEFYDHGPDYFYVALYEDGAEEPIEIKRVLQHPTNDNLTSWFQFVNIDLTKDYRIKVWDGGFTLAEGGEDIPTNYLVHTYSWKGYPGVNALDALTMVKMWRGDDMTEDFWWLGEGPTAGDYGFLSNTIADVTASGALEFSDIRALLYRSVGTYAQFIDTEGNLTIPNFQVAGRFVEELPKKTFGVAADGEVTGFAAANDDDIMFSFVNEAATFGQFVNPNMMHYISDVIEPRGSHTYINVYYVGMGDVNSKNTTVVGGGVNKTTTAMLDYTGVKEAQVGDVITLPVSLRDGAEFAGHNIGLTFNNAQVEVLEVEGYEFVNIDNEAGFVRVAAVDTRDEFYQAGETILNVTVKVLDELKDAQLFALESNTVFGNMDLEEVPVTLTTTMVAAGMPTGIDQTGAEKLSVNNYPNPFRTTTTIEYTLPESGKVTLVVYNRVGQVVTTMVDETQEAGRHAVELNRADLGDGDGMYIYRITVEGQTRTFTANGNLILMK